MSGRVLARLPLWGRLVAAVLLLVSVALVAIGAAGVRVLHGQLLNRTDGQLKTMARDYPRYLSDSPDAVSPLPPAAAIGLFKVERRDLEGKLVNDARQEVAPAPNLGIPEDAAWLADHAGHPMTMSAHASRWRVLVQPLPDAPGWIVAAAALGELDSTIAKLVRVDMIVGALGLAVLSVAGIVIVRVSLRPLVEVERTAAAIAAGDLSRRVPERPQQTELGRLGHALNSMLTQIEEGFRARAESEATARRSEERMRRFVADAGHELRTPLSVIRAWVEYSQRGSVQERADLERALSTVGAEATRMGMLVEDLLLLARLDQQRALELRPVDILELAVETARDARLLAPDRDIRLTVDENATYVVTGDELRLRQVLSNLTSNALAHTPQGTPISITLGPGLLGEAPALVLDVADQGPGLAPEQAERVFERFYRTDTSRTRRTGGSGLGLAIVASLATAHGGTVSVHSLAGAGATFRLTLPLADVNTPWGSGAPDAPRP